MQCLQSIIVSPDNGYVNIWKPESIWSSISGMFPAVSTKFALLILLPSTFHRSRDSEKLIL